MKGVGPALARILGQRGIHTVEDLLFFFPRAYEDRRSFTRIADLLPETTTTVAAAVRSVRWVPAPRPRMHVVVGDESGSLELIWFSARRGQDREFRVGRKMLATGKAKAFGSRMSIAHPEITWDADPASDPDPLRHTGRIVPIYTELEGISSRIWRNVLANALERYARDVREVLPDSLLKKHDLLPRAQAIRALHFPEGEPEKYAEFLAPAQTRMIFEEFYFFAKSIHTSRANRTRISAVTLDRARAEATLRSLVSGLPFGLTDDQRKAVDLTLERMIRREVVNLLLQGDVGSGKTIVALLMAAVLLDQGFSTALLAPTEILAQQHVRSAQQFFKDLPVTMLVGSLSRLERSATLERIRQPTLCIGTHALFEPDVQFHQLGLVVIDEQHRFGVDQRRRLREKGALPHLIAMSATPIPRTLALALYGDLDNLQIRQKPKGRKPIATQIVRKAARERAWSEIKRALEKGEQGYLISPFVQDSEAEGFEEVASAERSLQEARTRCPNLRIEMLHGRISAEEKSAILGRFSQNQIDLLVCTTVVEVGIDVPNATLMIIQNADRFGLAALHQLRGRVGRGSRESRCFLFMTGDRAGETAEDRLSILESSQDGFEIAEADLRIRGPGQLVGTAQAGLLAFRIADVTRDTVILEKANAAALETDSGDRVSEDTITLGASRHSS